MPNIDSIGFNLIIEIQQIILKAAIGWKKLITEEQRLTADISSETRKPITVHWSRSVVSDSLQPLGL